MKTIDGIKMNDDDAKRIEELEEQKEYFDRMQYIKKIQLNS